MNTKAALATYDDYLTLPDDGNRYEIIGGELLMAPAPSTYHQDILIKLVYSIQQFLNKSKQSKISIAPVDVVLSMTDVVQPDLVFVSRERKQIITKKNIVAAPDLVAEILSPHTEVIDRSRKKELYERYGVKEYWIVDAEQQQVEQFLLENNIFLPGNVFNVSDRLTSTVIEGLEVTVQEVFSF